MRIIKRSTLLVVVLSVFVSTFLTQERENNTVQKVKPHKVYKFPTHLLMRKYSNISKTIIQNRERIDYILASPALAKSCVKV